MPSPIFVTLVGFGAIGQAIMARLKNQSAIQVNSVVVRASRVQQVQQQLGDAINVSAYVPSGCQLLLECAGHEALSVHVVPALEKGIECAVLSIGALSDPELLAKIDAAAIKGGAQIHLLAGAIGGIDAIAAAKLEGLTSVTYIGRKPPAGWKGSAAETLIDLDRISTAQVFFTGSARQAAALFPKNSNVAATVSLAGLGLDKTTAQLIADPNVSDNIHEIEVTGAFGTMKLSMQGKPLADNPRTSALTVMSALRFLHNRVANITI
jgi:aspartate dehydrogenase